MEINAHVCGVAWDNIEHEYWRNAAKESQAVPKCTSRRAIDEQAIIIKVMTRMCDNRP